MLECECLLYSLIPRPSPFFVLQFAFSIIHGSGRVAKAEGLGTLNTSTMSGGRKMDIAGEGSTFKYMK